MAIEITVLIALIGCALSVGTFFVGRMTAAKNDGFKIQSVGDILKCQKESSTGSYRPFWEGCSVFSVHISKCTENANQRMIVVHNVCFVQKSSAIIKSTA